MESAARFNIIFDVVRLLAFCSRHELQNSMARLALNKLKEMKRNSSKEEIISSIGAHVLFSWCLSRDQKTLLWHLSHSLVIIINNISSARSASSSNPFESLFFRIHFWLITRGRKESKSVSFLFSFFFPPFFCCNNRPTVGLEWCFSRKVWITLTISTWFTAVWGKKLNGKKFIRVRTSRITDFLFSWIVKRVGRSFSTSKKSTVLKIDTKMAKGGCRF